MAGEGIGGTRENPNIKTVEGTSPETEDAIGNRGVADEDGLAIVEQFTTGAAARTQAQHRTLTGVDFKDIVQTANEILVSPPPEGLGKEYSLKIGRARAGPDWRASDEFRTMTRAINWAIDGHRHRRKTRELSANTVTLAEPPDHRQPKASDIDLTIELCEVMANLSPELQEILHHKLEGYSFEQIDAKLGWRKGRAWERFAKVRTSLAMKLAAYDS